MAKEIHKRKAAAMNHSGLRYSAYLGRTKTGEGSARAYLPHVSLHCLPVRSRTFQWITPFLFFELLMLIFYHHTNYLQNIFFINCSTPNLA